MTWSVREDDGLVFLHRLEMATSTESKKATDSESESDRCDQALEQMMSSTEGSVVLESVVPGEKEVLMDVLDLELEEEGRSGVRLEQGERRACQRALAEARGGQRCWGDEVVDPGLRRLALKVSWRGERRWVSKGADEERQAEMKPEPRTPRGRRQTGSVLRLEN